MKNWLVLILHVCGCNLVMAWPWTRAAEAPMPEIEQKTNRDINTNHTNTSLATCSSIPPQIEDVSMVKFGWIEIADSDASGLLLGLILVFNMFVYWTVVLYAYLLYRLRLSEQKQYFELALSLTCKCEALAREWMVLGSSVPPSCAMCASVVNKRIGPSNVGRPDMKQADTRSFYSKPEETHASAMYTLPDLGLE
jgi:hypothetical protein